MLVLPAVAALLLTSRLRAAWCGGVVGCAAGADRLALLLLSRDFPSSALIVALSFGLLLPALLYSSLKRS
jgi:ABC-type Mn2+/Zn2+ transport system permease subunit